MRWLLVDRLLKCDPGKSATAIKNFSRTDPFFDDHFPGNPVVPGVLLVEMIAKTGRICFQIDQPGLHPLIGVIKSARFHHPVVPGDQCRIQVTLSSSTPDYYVASGTVSVDGKKVADAEILLAIQQGAAPQSADPMIGPVIEDWKKRMGNQP